MDNKEEKKCLCICTKCGLSCNDCTCEQCTCEEDCTCEDNCTCDEKCNCTKKNTQAE